jgi:hypothetical protein
MLNSHPAALPDKPAFIWRLLIKTGIRKRLVAAMSCDPIAGNTIILSRFRGKILFKYDSIYSSVNRTDIMVSVCVQASEQGDVTVGAACAGYLAHG